jgi:hypothetical protein
MDKPKQSRRTPKIVVTTATPDGDTSDTPCQALDVTTQDPRRMDWGRLTSLRASGHGEHITWFSWACTRPPDRSRPEKSCGNADPIGPHIESSRRKMEDTASSPLAVHNSQKCQMSARLLCIYYNYTDPSLGNRTPDLSFCGMTPLPVRQHAPHETEYWMINKYLYLHCIVCKCYIAVPRSTNIHYLSHFVGFCLAGLVQR